MSPRGRGIEVRYALYKKGLFMDDGRSQNGNGGVLNMSLKFCIIWGFVVSLCLTETVDLMN